MTVQFAADDSFDTRMTSKGQVLIPKAIRERSGLAPNTPVRVSINDRGETIIAPRRDEETREERRKRIRAALDSVRGTIDIGFATTDEYMDFIRPHRLDPL